MIAGQNKDFKAIRESFIAPVYRGKILSTYFPNEFLCIFSDEHLDYFLTKLGLDIDPKEDSIDKQNKIIAWKKTDERAKKWSSYLLSAFLYESFGRPFVEGKKQNDIQDEYEKNYPSDYVSKVKITIGGWNELIKDSSVFTDTDIDLMKRIYLGDNHAKTCDDLAIEDGLSQLSYIEPVVELAKRISTKMNLKPIIGLEGEQTWWRILFWGRRRDDGQFEWKLQPKLAKALGLTYPELNREKNDEIEEKEDKNLIDALKRAKLNGTSDGFSHKGVPKKKQAPVYTNGHKTHPRDKQTAINALAHANYECEIDKNHPGFIRRRSDKNYTEPHHLIPMAYSDQFNVSLDVEENIVSLCSNCHNQIHYGKEAKILLKKLFYERNEALDRVEINVSVDQLFQMYKIKG